jgi:hypothetical protein
MKNSEWIEAVLPAAADRLYKKLLDEDPVSRKYAATPVTTAMYHLSRHAQNFSVTPVKVSKGKVTGTRPKFCNVPPRTCKAYGLAQALLSCQKGAPGIGAAVIFNYVRAARSLRMGLGKTLKDFSPATKALVRQLRKQAAGFSEDGKGLLVEAILVHDNLIRDWKLLRNLGGSIANVFLSESTRIGSGKKQDQHHLDQITAPLLGCYSDTEIAELVPDGEDPGENNELAIARVANRRKKLTGSRKGGRFGKPGRPRKTRRET